MPALHGPTGRRRTRLSPEERRQQLLALGVAWLADRPLEAISVEDLAAAAGVSPGLVFYYFGTRQGLHQQIVLTARDAMLYATEPDASLPAQERLRDVLERFVGFVQEHGATFYSIVRGASSGDPQVRETVQQARDALARHATTMVTELGVGPTPLIDVAVRAWISLAEQALVDAAMGGLVPADELVAFLERSALATVRAATPPT
ncbi:TetR/AcrR family transcriptional regulator [Xylanimonas allomyrinae]|uniref:TetR/AcrR family transcriptional regulator n=1 Tax=Xylanimonas allomyrinae TaxID=2509459 RepID=A0A4P6ENN7_9MICO|nr:TetR/AcrR family transcriptional regulator [Xylanimonas allomyrinae]QAY64334.1 TetR/AcrR family transcriptional regulator [Xylanimonas allomyrinae]